MVLDDGGPLFHVLLDGGLRFAPAAIGGRFDIQLQDAAWVVNATQAYAVLQAGSATVALRQGAGSLTLGPNYARSGQITGTAEVTGVDGLTLSGQFATRFDGAGNLQLAGAVEVGVDGFAKLNGQFAVTKQVVPEVVPEVILTRSVGDTVGSFTGLTEGGVQTNTRYRLEAYANGEFREGSYAFEYQGARGSVDSTNKSDDIFKSDLKAGLEGLFGQNAITVTGTRATGFEITLTGARAGRDVAGLTMTPPADPAVTAEWGFTRVVEDAKPAATMAEYYLLLQPPRTVSRDSTNLVFQFANSAVTGSARYTGIQSTQYNRVREALEKIVGVGNVTVVNHSQTPTSAQGYTIRLTSAALAKNLGALSVQVAGVDPIVATLTPKGNAASASPVATGTVQTIDGFSNAQRGTFQMAFTLAGRTFQSAAIDFHADAASVRQAILAAQDATGSYAAMDGDAEVTSLANQWRVTFTGSALGKAVPAMIVTVTPHLAPDAQWTQTATGSTTSESQKITVQGSSPFALALAGQVTAPLAANSSADAVRLALEELTAIGRGNVAVTSVAGGWQVDFVGALAGKNIAALGISQVQTLDLRLKDGLVADTVALRFSGESAWAATLSMTGLENDARRALLEEALTGLTGVGVGNVTVLADASTPGLFRLVTTGALAGRSMSTVVAGLTRAVEQPASSLMIGAADVSGVFGSATAGVTLQNGRLGLVITRAAEGNANGYALLGSGTTALRGFGDAVTMNATGSLAVNTLGRAVNVAVPTGITTPVQQVTFADGTAMKELVIDQGAITVQNLGTLTGSLAVRVTGHKVSG
ncbi:MAG: hypothetical protein HQK87_10965, partial [Nitrospinae bacterium]|nr:hypothetical protein [Nitrospinota bacterium]